MKQDFFNELKNTRPFLKMALEGFAGSGKTFTSAKIAIGLHKYIKSDKPIVWYDTEKALKALKPFFDKAGIKVLTRESRSLADLEKTFDFCEGGVADILIIDSITHVWETFIENYRNEKKRTFIHFQDWGILKPAWKKKFSDRLVHSKIHVIFTGRAGYEYDQEVNEDTGKKELIKTGIKMKVENETEYEPDIVVLMEKIKELSGKSMKIKRQATVIKDRTTEIDGKEFINPAFKDFFKAIKILLSGEAVDLELSESKDTFADFEKEFYEKRNLKTIAVEEIEGIIAGLFPGQSVKEKKIKLDIIEKIFNTRSWTKVQSLSLFELQGAVETLKEFKTNVANYYAECTENGTEPDPKTILEMLEDREVFYEETK